MPFLDRYFIVYKGRREKSKGKKSQGKAVKSER
jgi:hypothetical protein